MIDVWGLLGDGPHVPEWMLRPEGAVHAAAFRMVGAAERVDRAGQGIERVLSEAAGVLGWRSSGAEAARTHVDEARGQVGQFRDLLSRSENALETLTVAIREHQPELKRCRRRRRELLEDAVGEGAKILVPPPLLPQGDNPLKRVNEIIAEIRGIDREIQGHVEAMAQADRRARDELQGVADGLSALGSVDREDDWVSSSLPLDAVDFLAGHGVTESAGERALLDKILLLPDGRDGGRQLRELLAAMTPAELSDFLLRHPDVGRRLAGPLDPVSSYLPGSAEAALATALAAGASLPPKERIAAIRAAFARMSPGERDRLALLYPEVVGNLDGAPLDLRMAANRVKIGVALDDEWQRQVTRQRAVLGQTGVERWWARVNDRGVVTIGGVPIVLEDFDDAPSALQRTSQRIDYYTRLLYEEPRNPTYLPGTGRPEAGPHQVLYFDPSGDGTIAEMWGTLGPDTRNVAVLTPGTTVDMENFGHDSEKMRWLAEDDPNKSTVTVAWLGVDMPDAVAGDAPYSSYAEEGGPRLRDFVVGLDIPPQLRVTAIGHSYGGAVTGVAEREGLEVDQALHISSAGTGRDVFSVEDYASGGSTRRYSMTPPGDPIDLAQDKQFGVPFTEIGHGGDPDGMDGFTRLETGRYPPGHPKAGRMIQGIAAHNDVTTARGSTAWNNILGVVTGGEVTTYTPPTVTEYDPFNGGTPNPVFPWGNPTTKEYPYEDPNFEGPKVDIP